MNVPPPEGRSPERGRPTQGRLDRRERPARKSETPARREPGAAAAPSPAPSPAPSREDAWLEPLLARLQGIAAAHVQLGPGHDCAAVDLGDETLVVTTDALVDGVHFRLDQVSPQAAVQKALAVNLSDLAAAAAIPRGFVISCVLPSRTDAALFEALADGIALAAEAFGCPCVGGDTNRGGGPLVLAVTAFGRPGPMGVVSRRGARPGMRLSVTGALGGSIHGRHLRVVPRVAEAQVLARHGLPAAMLDVSDGLALDLTRLCRSSGVGALIDAAQIPIHPDARCGDEQDPLQRALSDGEDFELLLAHAPLDDERRAALAQEGVRLIEIGQVTAADAGIRLRRSGQIETLAPSGFDHLSAGSEPDSGMEGGPDGQVPDPR